jgi:hypothetical protein
MDDYMFDETVKRLEKVDGVIKNLDSAIRAEAFSLLKPYISAGATGSTGSTAADSGSSNGTEQQAAMDFADAEAFFTTHEDGKPSDNAYLVTAYLYTQYGSSPFSIDDVRAVADHAGLTLPDRVDVTLAGAKKGGKQLFKRAGRGMLQPNVHGETYLRNTYNIIKGTKRRTG